MKALLALFVLFVCLSFTVDYLWIGCGIDIDILFVCLSRWIICG